MIQVSEMYLTVQGEATNTGRPAIFIRLKGCNLWNGKQDQRNKPACAAYCDVVALEDQEPGVAGRTSFARTDGPGGGTYTGEELSDAIDKMWPGSDPLPFVVLTGGEPTLQCKPELFEALGWYDVAIETNGTTDVELPKAWHVTVSPKGEYPLLRTTGTELKLLFPQMEHAAFPHVFERMAHDDKIDFERYYLQAIEPLPGPDHDAVWGERMTAARVYCENNPFWRLSIQTHKWLKVP